METRVASSLFTGSIHGRELVRELEARLGSPPALVLVFASPKRDLGALLPQVSEAAGGATVLGATTAGEFTEKGEAKGAVSAVALAGDFKVHAGLGTGLKADYEGALGRAIDGLPVQEEGYPHRTGLLLFDALAGHGEELSLLAAALLGDGLRLAGGAAGDDLHMKQTQVGLNGRVTDDAVVVAEVFSKRPVGLGVSHGHEPISGPLRVTKAEGSRVFEVEGRPAWEVWREQTRAAARGRGIDVDGLEGDALGAFLLRYEAGLSAGRGYKIRAPLQRLDDGSLVFACELPEGTTFRITESVADRQIESARKAARLARERLGGAEPAGAVVFDCICRNLILQDRFTDAVRAIGGELGDTPLAGFETYGEVALDAGDMSGFHNTTTVVLAFAR